MQYRLRTARFFVDKSPQNDSAPLRVDSICFWADIVCAPTKKDKRTAQNEGRILNPPLHHPSIACHSERNEESFRWVYRRFFGHQCPQNNNEDIRNDRAEGCECPLNNDKRPPIRGLSLTHMEIISDPYENRLRLIRDLSQSCPLPIRSLSGIVRGLTQIRNIKEYSYF